GATADSATEFLRSKSRGDEAVRCSAIEWVILRPGLVLAPNAYGGSALLRMAAGVPLVEGALLPDAQIQTVSIDDVCECICEAVDGRVESGSDIEVLETQIHTLAEVTRAFRQWLGFAPPYLRISVPRQLAYAAAWLADGLSLLGWRSPLRTTALNSLEAGVTGDAAKATAILGRNPRSMTQTLAAMPSTLQDRWFARLYLLLPVIVATLAAFWIASGFVGLVRVAEAASVISPAWASPRVAGVAVVGLSALDITLGLAVLFRSSARKACGAMIVVSLLYLIGATIVAPALWLDPMGPLVKVVPAMVLALVTMAVLEER
ncbi:MAG TPA: SDR family oxidoreductase, partial [Permianibacter sp.]|nr:SDR family oxidoreductase [Permianibacter sp.]